MGRRSAVVLAAIGLVALGTSCGDDSGVQPLSMPDSAAPESTSTIPEGRDPEGQPDLGEGPADTEAELDKIAMPEVIATTNLGEGIFHLLITDDGLYAARTAGDTILRLDPDTLEIETESDEAYGLADDADDICNSITSQLESGQHPCAIDPEADLKNSGLKITAYDVSDDSVWIVDPTSQRLVQMDNQSLEFQRYLHLGGEPTAVLAHDGAIWVTLTDYRKFADDAAAAALLRIDPSTMIVTDTYPYEEGTTVEETLDRDQGVPLAISNGQLLVGLTATSESEGTVTVSWHDVEGRQEKRELTTEDGICEGPAGGPDRCSALVSGDDLWIVENPNFRMAGTGRNAVGRAAGAADELATAVVIEESGATGDLLLGDAAWLVTGQSGSATLIDPATMQVSEILQFESAANVSTGTAAGDRLWVADISTGDVTLVGPAGS
ncbi:MAG: hypothetical protein RIB98_15050 [Acidimicrobiales bacterium]